MDLLASLGLGNELPEQSTREIPGIIKALDGDDGEDVNDDVRLGFNRCLHCGVKLSRDDAAAATTTTAKLIGAKKGRITCRGCHRVSYCSHLCMKADASPSDRDDELGSLGHSPVVCSLLGLCDDDEVAEEELLGGRGGGGGESGSNDGEVEASSRAGSDRKCSSEGRRDAARYRVQTERESYPATLFNILSEGPDWFVEAITRRLRCNQDVRSPMSTSTSTSTGKRGGKRDRSSAFGKWDKQDGEGGYETPRSWRNIVLHVVGASAESELWNWDGKGKRGRSSRRNSDNDEKEDESLHVLDACAEASTNLATYLENLLQIRSITIRCIFIGPDCPLQDYVGSLPIPDSKSSTLTIETHRCKYGDAGQLDDLSAPDAIVFFNPGFTCPDYDWSTALSAAASWPTGPTPFLVATNTEIEGYADVKCLLDGGHIDPRSLPVDVLDAMDHRIPFADKDRRRRSQDDDDDYSREAFLFRMNPYAGLRVRQSGTMGNDLYVKNRWIICGLFRTSIGLVGSGRKTTRDRIGGKSTVDSDDEYDGGKRSRKRRRDEGHRSDKPHREGGEKNAKWSNPALI
ncbi:hypothetical protein ACHAXA_002016 [Cyclostephanos tholiformis]|uniref:Mitochondrial splicing suppressor 51-like C-terminal domain-containing protein n=1 Tax=Cyclostephanos tholiformis TaxID=382380 RepID=A0ABD3SSD6_9STRA